MAENTAGYLALEIKIDDSNVAAEMAMATAKAQKYWQSSFHLSLARDELSSVIAAIEKTEQSFNKMSAARLRATSLPLDFDKDVQFYPFAGVGNKLASAGGAVRAYRNEGNEAVRTQKAIAEATMEAHARFGVMANSVTGASTVMRLLGAETGMAGVEMARTVLYFGRATTAGGGMIGVINSLAGSFKTFWVALGPVGQVLTVAITLYTALTAAINKAKQAAEGAAKAFADQAGAISAVLESQRDLGLAKDPSRAHEIAVERLMDTDPNMTKERAEIITINKERAEGITESRKFIRDFNDEQREAEEDARKKRVQDNFRDLMALNARRSALQDEILILQGRNKYDVLYADSQHKSLAKTRDRLLILQEIKEAEGKRSQILQEADGTGQGTSALGPSGSAFRFGPGAMGSTIGAETEQKKTNIILERIDKKIADLNTSLTEEGLDAKLPGYEN